MAVSCLESFCVVVVSSAGIPARAEFRGSALGSYDSSQTQGDSDLSRQYSPLTFNDSPPNR